MFAMMTTNIFGKCPGCNNEDLIVKSMECNKVELECQCGKKFNKPLTK